MVAGNFFEGVPGADTYLLSWILHDWNDDDAALLEAVSHERIETLRLRAHDLTDREDSRDALLEWLSAVVDYCVSARGLAAALAYDGAGADLVQGNSCAAARADRLFRLAVAGLSPGADC